MLKSTVLAVMLLMVAIPPASAQTSGPEAVPGPFDAAARGAAVHAAAKALREIYVYPEVANRAGATIEANLAAGGYDDLTDRAVFADRLTRDLAGIAHDKHMRVMAKGAPPPPDTLNMGPPPRNEFGVVRADRLAGGVGYVEVSGFPPPEAFEPAARRAMAALAGSKAVIVDLRRNGGGSPASVAYFASFFFDGAKPTHLNDLVRRNPATETFHTEAFHTTPTPTRFVGVPVYLLTSETTISGGEEFAYDLQTQKRAVLVGEVTAGAANPGGVQPIGPGLTIFMPNGRAENPITRTNWEGRGVTPEVAVPHDDALRVALQRLGQPANSGTIETLSQEQVFAPHTTPTPESLATARRLVAEAATQQWGAVRSVVFREVGPGGADVYDVKFAHGDARLTLVLAEDGKALIANLRPV